MIRASYLITIGANRKLTNECADKLQDSLPVCDTPTGLVANVTCHCAEPAMAGKQKFTRAVLILKRIAVALSATDTGNSVVTSNRPNAGTEQHGDTEGDQHA